MFTSVVNSDECFHCVKETIICQATFHTKIYKKMIILVSAFFQPKI